MGQAELLRDARHVSKMFYIMADDLFYEALDRHYTPSEELTSLVQGIFRNESKNWEIVRDGVWSHVRPMSELNKLLPAQGWKIHVSATTTNCLEILAKVASIALDHDVRFKFANDINTLVLMTSKQWARGGSGKFITLYPGTEEEFRSIIARIHVAVQDHRGPYILSDKRYMNCQCLYYRYGGILQEHSLDFMGFLQPILTSPQGEKVPDVRHPYFNMPPWVKDPFPEDEDDGKGPEMTLDKGRYTIKRALALSNTGGVYLATDQRTGKDVVVKEARPLTEVDRHGHDAIFRLKREERMLRVLDGQGIAPTPISTFGDWENFYLVEEYFDATDIREIMLVHSPALRVNPNASDAESFYAIFKSIFVSLLTGIRRTHQLGVVIGDLSAVNILIDEASYTAKIIDFEAAYQPGIDDPSDIYTPGFRGMAAIREDKRGYADDVYAMAALMLYCIFPIVAISSLRNDLFTTILPIILADVGWSQTHLHEIIVGLATNTMSCDRACELLEMPVVFETPLSTAGSRQDTSPQDYTELAQFLLHSYRTDDKFTLFPLDPFALHTNAFGLGFGSTGVVYSLKKCGFDVPKPALGRFLQEIGKIKPQDLAPGILTGSAGIALAFFGLENDDEAQRFLDYANSSPLLRRHHSFYYGMAGIGMSNLVAYQRTGNSKYLDVACDLAETLAQNAKTDHNGTYWDDNGLIHLGFGYGQSGIALFFLRLSQVLCVSSWSDLGRKALNYDLSHGYEIEPGVLSFPRTPGDHTMYEQYIEEGSAGIAKVAIRYGMWDVVDPILADVHRKYSGFAGLLYGMSSFVDVLVDAYLYSGNAKYLDMAKRPVAGIHDLYFLKQPHGYATPGDNLFRVSCDYATGVAGVMRTLYRMNHLVKADFTLDELDDRVLVGGPEYIDEPIPQQTSYA